MNIQKLDKEFIGKGEVKGFTFNQVRSDKISYVYKVNDSYYEVFKKRVNPVCIDFENRVYSETDFVEAYPKKNAFGKEAFTVGSLEKAQKYIDRWLKNSKKKDK